MADYAISIKGYARIVGVSPRTIERMIVSGEVPRPIRLSPGRRGWMMSEVEGWLEKRKAERDQRAA